MNRCLPPLLSGETDLNLETTDNDLEDDPDLDLVWDLDLDLDLVFDLDL